MRRLTKSSGIERLKNRYGLIFVSPWILGMLLFFVIPVAKSVIYSFSKVSVFSGEIEMNFIGLDNYRKILISDPNYLNQLIASVTPLIYSLPIIVLLSMVLAILLNQKFRGRLIFRALYFLPVIIATGEVIDYLFQTTRGGLTSIGVSESFSAGMIDISEIVSQLGFSGQTAEIIMMVINRIFDLIWSCGIQTVLFLAGLQSIPSSVYEASKVEGANKWEEFWFITFPSLSRITLLVLVFTMIELITDEQTELVTRVYDTMHTAVYDLSSAMIWFYFLISGTVMGIIVLLYNRLLMKRWE